MKAELILSFQVSLTFLRKAFEDCSSRKEGFSTGTEASLPAAEEGCFIFIFILASTGLATDSLPCLSLFSSKGRRALPVNSLVSVSRLIAAFSLCHLL